MCVCEVLLHLVRVYCLCEGLLPLQLSQSVAVTYDLHDVMILLLSGVGFVGRNMVHYLVSNNLCSKVS